MTQEAVVSHWQQRARAELKGARVLFEQGDVNLYAEVLFHCHLALELALKARYLLENNTTVPFTHDLNQLADLLQGDRNEAEKDELEQITEFAILSRYGDEKWFASQATAANAEKCLQKTEHILLTLLES